ncbi:MAG: class I SAM-dependent methyltransferase [Planctomycetes bacterium]|nr:class I SAM-dependent methyltransferase [Planctomycetota bacterium]
MLGILVKGIRRVFTKGPKDTARWARYHLYEGYREWSLGIETASCDEWKDSYDDPAYIKYEPLSYECIDGAFSSLEIRAGEDVFLDYGCGKGRIVTVAATYPFRRVIGVEMLPALSAIAEENLRQAKRRLKCPNEIVTADACTYSVPSDVTVIFLFNPFQGEVLRAVQEQIRRSLVAHPRPLTLLYVNPTDHEETFASCDWLVPKRSLSAGMWDGIRFIAYQSRVPVPVHGA